MGAFVVIWALRLLRDDLVFQQSKLVMVHNVSVLRA